jgi:hypothetical protein
MVEAAGIENVFTLMKSGTYGRNRCLKSASWTFASCRNTSHGPPSGSKQIRHDSVSFPPLLPALATIGYRLRGRWASDQPELRPPPITREGLYK